MAIVTMKKFTLLAFHEHKQPLLKELQKFEDVHLRNLQDADLEELDFLQQDFSPEQTLHCEGELEKVKFALGKIAPYAPKAKLTDKRPTMDFSAFDTYLDQYDYTSVCKQVKELDDKISSIRSEISRLRMENEGLSNWINLDVPPKELEKLTTVRALLGSINQAACGVFVAAVEEQFPTVYLEELGAVKEDKTLLLLVPAQEYDGLFGLAKDLGFSKASLNFDDVPKQMIASNKSRIAQLDEEQRKAQVEIESQGPAYTQLQIVRDYYVTLLERERARANFLSLDSVVLIEGWVPAEDTASLEKILTDVCGNQYYLELQEVERDSTEVPIKLKNNKFVTAFESITSMYSTPMYNEIDPTPLLAPFYWLFFGLMVGDIGYGLLMVVATGCALKFLDLKKMRGFIQFFFYLGFAVIAGGLLYGGAFGVTIVAPITYVENGQVMRKAILDSQASLDIQLMLVMSIALGVIHIFFGLFVKGYMLLRDGKPFAAFCDALLWVTVLSGGIGWLLGVAGFLPGDISNVCKWIFWASLIGLALTQGRESPSIGGKIGNGLYGVYGLTSYVGDLVSYTRIVALALSGAYIAFSFNLMTTLLPAGIIRLVGGIIVVVLGQSLNLGLALLGAYVHTCRLQYVEFFGKFYEGGGKPFQPLQLKNESVEIKK